MLAFPENQLLDLLEAMPDAIVMVNAGGEIVVANGQAERLFGYDHGQMLGQAVEILLPQRYHQAHQSHRHGFFQLPHTRSMGAGLELFGRRRDATEFPVEISLSPIDAASGH